MINCNVHGNEASGRESCFTRPASSRSATDPAIVEMLSRMTVLMVPSINADGRAANTRGNTHGPGPQPRPRPDRAERDQGLREDDARLHARRRGSTTTRATARTCRSSPRATSTSTSRSSKRASHGQRRGCTAPRRSRAGGWARTAPAATATRASCATPASLKNGVSMLGEARAAAGPTRPAEGGSNSRAEPASARSTRTCGRTGRAMRYFDARMDTDPGRQRRSPRRRPAGERRPARRSCAARTRGRCHRGRREPERPAGRGHAAGSADPRLRRPCGYFITTGRVHGGSPERGRRGRHGRQRGAAPGDPRHQGRAAGPGGVFVPLRQRLRGLIAPILDSQAVLPMIETARAPLLLPRATCRSAAPSRRRCR